MGLPTCTGIWRRLEVVMPPAVYGPQGSAPITSPSTAHLSVPQACPSLANLATKLCSSYCCACSALFSPIVSRALQTYTLYHGVIGCLLAGLVGVSCHISHQLLHTLPPTQSQLRSVRSISTWTLHTSTISTANVTTRYERWPISTNCCNSH